MTYARASGRVSSDEDADSSPASPRFPSGSIDDSSQANQPGSMTFFTTPSSPTATTEPSFEPSQYPPDPSLPSRHVPSLRTVSDSQTTTAAHMSSTSSLSGTLSNARRPPASVGNLPQGLMQKARDLQQQRMAMSPHATPGGPGGPGGPLSDPSRGPAIGLGGPLAGGISNLRMPPHMNRNMNIAIGGIGGMVSPTSSIGRGPVPSLSERRAMKLGPLPGGAPGTPGASSSEASSTGSNSRINDFKHYIDTEKGWITFEGAATITRTGVNFAGGHTFKISLDELQVLDELGKGNYGTVYKVRHAKPAKPRFGPGLSGFKRPIASAASIAPAAVSSPTAGSSVQTPLGGDGPPPPTTRATGASLASLTRTPSTAKSTGKIMAMKEIRLELDEAKFTTILKELVILHECVSPYIIDFYGAFYQEGAVYMCIEYMDGGSIDKLYAGGIPESVLRKITYSAVMGLKSLKDEHNIIHRDVKPTNILVNTSGHAKICDFGVSGNLVASIAKTNIGCQSYMAPERISGGAMMQNNSGGNGATVATSGTYGVQSDIWSLGLTIIECAMGCYPYPPEVSASIFGQLTAIVTGDPPEMPTTYSPEVRDFVRSCLAKNPLKRHTYSELLEHAWLKPIVEQRAAERAALSPEDEDKKVKGKEAAVTVADTQGKVEAMDLSDKAEQRQAAISIVGDAELAAWVTKRLAEIKTEDEAAGYSVAKPALHSAPTDPTA